MDPRNNPLDFLRFTHKDNCGDCGQPTCLAFAVAVTKGGADPRGCPHLAPDCPVLEDSTPSRGENGAGGGLARVTRGQEARDLALVAHLKGKLRDLDLASLAPVLGCGVESSPQPALRFRYLGQEVVLSKEDVRLAGAEVVDPRDQILLYNYVSFAGDRGEAPTAPADGDWIGMESLPNSISKVRTLAVYAETPLASRFDGRLPRLLELAARVDGRRAAGAADLAIEIPVLPRVPHLLLCWQSDEEEGFEAKVKLLFRPDVLRYLDLESLVFSAERLAETLAALDEGP